MIPHQQAAFVRQQARQPGAFCRGVRHPAVQRIDGDPVKIAGRVLVDGQDLRRRQTGEAGGVHRVQMQHHPHVREPLMDLPVNSPRGGIDVRARGATFIIGVQHQQIAGADARKVFPLRVE